MKMSFLIVLALAQCLTLAQSQAGGRLSGTVLSEEERVPLSGVNLILVANRRMTTTTVAGKFIFEHLYRGSDTLIAAYIGRELFRKAIDLSEDTPTMLISLPISVLPLDEMISTATEDKRSRFSIPASVGVINRETIDREQPAHPSELMSRIAGVWVNQTTGEGHMTAIRQPLSILPLYLFLEDGVPTRSTGFFNHNALFEVNLPMAERVEIIRGPGTALYGSDAIGGIINVITKSPPPSRSTRLSISVGQFGFARGLISVGDRLGNGGIRLDVNYTRSDGWRDGTDYQRLGSTLRWDHYFGANIHLKSVAAWSLVDLHPAGYAPISESDFNNNPDIHYTPISFRDVGAFRIQTSLDRLTDNARTTVTPYARINKMELLPNWALTFDPAIWMSNHNSIGLKLRHEQSLYQAKIRAIIGLNAERSPGERVETAILPLRDGSIFTSYGTDSLQYDYAVTFSQLSPFVHLEYAPHPSLLLSGGMRFDHLCYDYRNHLTTIRTGSHRRPADVQPAYDHLSPKLGMSWYLRAETNLFLSFRHAFRVADERQLFRQGSNENSIDLKPVNAEQLELGIRGKIGRLDYELTGYYLTKTDDILRYDDENGVRFDVNAGETRHRGVELQTGFQLFDGVNLITAFSLAEHTYQSWQPRNDLSFDGNQMEQAPHEIFFARIDCQPSWLPGLRLSTEWSAIGSYYMDPANEFRYNGHALLTARAHYRFGEHVSGFLRVNNLTDALYAERATYNAFRGAEFAPGLPRTFYGGVSLSLTSGR